MKQDMQVALYIYCGFMLILKQERKPVIIDAGTAEFLKGIFKVMAGAFLILLGLDFLSVATTFYSPSAGVVSFGNHIFYAFVSCHSFGKQRLLTVIHPFFFCWYSYCSFMQPRWLM